MCLFRFHVAHVCCGFITLSPKHDVVLKIDLARALYGLQIQLRSPCLLATVSNNGGGVRSSIYLNCIFAPCGFASSVGNRRAELVSMLASDASRGWAWPTLTLYQTPHGLCETASVHVAFRLLRFMCLILRTAMCCDIRRVCESH